MDSIPIGKNSYNTSSSNLTTLRFDKVTLPKCFNMELNEHDSFILDVRLYV